SRASRAWRAPVDAPAISRRRRSARAAPRAMPTAPAAPVRVLAERRALRARARPAVATRQAPAGLAWAEAPRAARAPARGRDVVGRTAAHREAAAPRERRDAAATRR